MSVFIDREAQLRSYKGRLGLIPIDISGKTLLSTRVTCPYLAVEQPVGDNLSTRTEETGEICAPLCRSGCLRRDRPTRLVTDFRIHEATLARIDIWGKLTVERTSFGRKSAQSDIDIWEKRAAVAVAGTFAKLIDSR